MPDREAALKAENLRMTFGETRALDDVSLTIEPGEMVALIGPSGSGKSTLLRVAAGLQVADRNSGPVHVLGRKMQERGRLASAVRTYRAPLGFIFQQFNLVGRLTLFRNVLLGALGQMSLWRGALGLFPDSTKQKAMDALERVGMSEFAGRRASNLSGGQQQRGAIARALVQGAEMLFADEPIASLDPVSARKVMELLAELNERDGLSVVVTLHQIGYAREYCDRIIALNAGQIVYDGPRDALTQDKLIEIYGSEYEAAFYGAEEEA
ncbi:MAG: phosphonate ABC transporter ATP-binding protein [Maricaulis sp.]|jgi:phosphonate transport system ATP-binding protein|uniref:phosphonate ABC transporter ATP-binding protein n=1 Tax=Maricaulis sp. TaxID=1486257 RepID=UPI001B2BD4CA|nr:phosphonate ABC transporter ATP-binding protein [Maricaulis sp.]MBO6728575.1 phosphonate ABC transporter ATP-binding protein [Maricaulis sp.]MBO6845915.1 phosphonate ABC transporter ATP-binding protein [Maricaulis sp.]MBO6876209.1 phosphonate ABC transporter ATP-binding protein [Maricaulis sp.]MDM7984385.1 phosphonate ABC transporter ATP-binding protein [Maricaulis sp.]